MANNYFNETNPGDALNTFIEYWVQQTLTEKTKIEVPEYVATDSIGEIIEKLVILHIRTWMLEDAIHFAKTDAEIADLKRKIDICFKVKRPKLVAAINRMMEDAVVNRRSLHEDSVKHYKGIDNA
jgi:hypothetical protein